MMSLNNHTFGFYRGLIASLISMGLVMFSPKVAKPRKEVRAEMMPAAFLEG